MNKIQLFFYVMGIIFVVLLLAGIFLSLLGIFLAGRAAKKQRERIGYVEHVCDRRFDGICVECSLNAGRAIIAHLVPQN